ncbi:hypothetical protein [Anaerococcus hydrogenalis]|nr:hypothetical protein [Anaerococcus hydrogenalis]
MHKISNKKKITNLSKAKTANLAIDIPTVSQKKKYKIGNATNNK